MHFHLFIKTTCMPLGFLSCTQIPMGCLNGYWLYIVFFHCIACISMSLFFRFRATHFCITEPVTDTEIRGINVPMTPQTSHTFHGLSCLIPESQGTGVVMLFFQYIDGNASVNVRSMPASLRNSRKSEDPSARHCSFIDSHWNGFASCAAMIRPGALARELWSIKGLFDF